jgi:hypothetical protein
MTLHECVTARVKTFSATDAACSAMGIAGVPPAVFGVPPKTFARRTNAPFSAFCRADWSDRDGRAPLFN